MGDPPRHIPPRGLPLAHHKPRRVMECNDRACTLCLGRGAHLQVQRAVVRRPLETGVHRLPGLDRPPRR